MEKLQEINPNKWYNLWYLFKNSYFENMGITNYKAIREMVKRDMQKRNILKTVVRSVEEGEAPNTARYQIKGEHLKTFLEEVDKGYLP